MKKNKTKPKKIISLQEKLFIQAFINVEGDNLTDNEKERMTINKILDGKFWFKVLKEYDSLKENMKWKKKF